MRDFLSLVRKVMSGRPPRLRFERERELRFQKSQAAARLRHFVVSGAVALVAYNLYLLSDRSMAPDMFDTALTMRVYIFTPIALTLMAAGIWLKDWLLSMPTALVEGLLMATGIYAALTIGVVMTGTESPFGLVYRAGMISLLIYGNLVQRFRFYYAVVFSSCVVGICMVGTAMTIGKPHVFGALDLPVTLLVLLIAVYTLVMNFRMELKERRRFLHAERTALMRDEIEASRLALRDLARQDPLTGLANRRHFDEITRRHWDGARGCGGPVALLLIDVDHFKAYNDRYGHPVGDQCLRHVAQLLKGVVPASQGTVARWGGEEFVVLLPGADAARAMAMARAMNAEVAGRTLRHEASPTAQFVTVSVGVAVADLGQSWCRWTRWSRAPTRPSIRPRIAGATPASAPRTIRRRLQPSRSPSHEYRTNARPYRRLDPPAPPPTIH